MTAISAVVLAALDKRLERKKLPMISSQMLKGMLENCILKIISIHETYGYEISQKLKTYGFMEISEGTIYPLLLRLEKNGSIVSEYKDSPSGPPRKYFSITEKGKNDMESFRRGWRELETAVNQVFGEEAESSGVNGNKEEAEK